jgi:hypothetical protein
MVAYGSRIEQRNFWNTLAHAPSRIAPSGATTFIGFQLLPQLEANKEGDCVMTVAR